MSAVKTCRGLLKTKKRFLFAWLLHLSHQLKVRCRPNQSHASTYTQAHKMEVKLTAGVVVRMIDKERDSDQCKARHGYVGGQWAAQPAQNYV